MVEMQGGPSGPPFFVARHRGIRLWNMALAEESYK
jgi:hypothetical protein